MTADDIRALIQFVKNETERDIAENQRKQNEQERQQAEAQRENNEDIRQAEEAQRQQNESSRQSAESARASAESVRASQESARVSAENDRIAAENARQAAESARQAAEVVREQVKNEAILATQEALDAASDATTAAASAHSAAQAANDAADRANTEAEKIENLEHKGEYDSNTLYVKNNEVRYNGSTWRALQDTQGNVPQEGPYWTLVAQRGLDGQGAVQSVAGKSPDINGDVPLSATDISFSPPSGMTSTNTQNAIVEVFQFGNERKQGLVDALIAIGVPASISEPWEDLIDKVESVIRATGNATPSDVRAGKTFSSASGNDQVGSIPVRTGGNVTPGPNDIVKDAGIYDTAITIQKVVVPADKVLAGTTIAGTAGTMPNRTGHVTGQSISRSGTTLRIRPPQGHYPGTSDNSVQWNDPNFIAANIMKGVSLFGLAGTLESRLFAEGSVGAASDHGYYEYVDGSGTGVSYLVTVTGLTFKPTIILLISNSAKMFTLYIGGYDDGFGTETAKEVSGYNGRNRQNTLVTNFKVGTQHVYVNNSGFSLPVDYPATFQWFAWK